MSIAVSRIAGISVPCVTVVAGLTIALACAGAPPTPPMRLAKSVAGLPVEAAAAAAPGSAIASVAGEAPASKTTVGLA